MSGDASVCPTLIIPLGDAARSVMARVWNGLARTTRCLRRHDVSSTTRSADLAYELHSSLESLSSERHRQHNYHSVSYDIRIFILGSPIAESLTLLPVALSALTEATAECDQFVHIEYFAVCPQSTGDQAAFCDTIESSFRFIHASKAIRSATAYLLSPIQAATELDRYQQTVVLAQLVALFAVMLPSRMHNVGHFVNLNKRRCSGGIYGVGLDCFVASNIHKTACIQIDGAIWRSLKQGFPSRHGLLDIDDLAASLRRQGVGLNEPCPHDSAACSIVKRKYLDNVVPRILFCLYSASINFEEMLTLCRDLAIQFQYGPTIPGLAINPSIQDRVRNGQKGDNLIIKSSLFSDVLHNVELELRTAVLNSGHHFADPQLPFEVDPGLTTPSTMRFTITGGMEEEALAIVSQTVLHVDPVPVIIFFGHFHPAPLYNMLREARATAVDRFYKYLQQNFIEWSNDKRRRIVAPNTPLSELQKRYLDRFGIGGTCPCVNYWCTSELLSQDDRDELIDTEDMSYFLHLIHLRA